ncbi:RelA/SpoT domain-containing protein [Mesorhizobium sp. M7A.F.Ca.US.010.02.1.1]|uniref:RelA/SpoT domain-containing protein n=2 Tax=Mesorhizobium TaxID=68287 RepID=UPI001FE14B43|nr:RelA/SpoT domain-containing protein [Mesorhizobium sp. M7A.F.Ca.US.010.02.1.1]
MGSDSPAIVRPVQNEAGYLDFLAPMTEYPRLAYSMKAVRKAGDRLAKPIQFGRDITVGQYVDALEIFSIANSWRDSHFLPMRSVRFSVGHHIRALRLEGDMASRPKRMASIRRKLRESTTNLDTMNDIGGCRAIMADIKGVRSLLASMRDKFPHEIHSREFNYIDEPKPDGYRSHHIVFKYRPRDADTEAFDGRRIELQVRTKLQHSWATAVEAVGLFRGQDLKHGEGDQDWLRLFQLMSAEFAHVEQCPVHVSVPDHNDRVRELRDLNKRIDAIGILEKINNTTHCPENFVHKAAKTRYYLLQYGKDHKLSIEPFWALILGARKLKEIEQKIELRGSEVKAVLVEVDKKEKLVEMYPNYFGDVYLFARNLKSICTGKAAIEYS